jgi:hypothetical protein
VISKLKNRDVSFRVEDGCLVRIVTSDAGDGRGYIHRCDKAVLETVAQAMDEVPPEGKGRTLAEIVRQEKLPFTQVNVALEFLKERGIVDVRHRRCYPASPGVHLDAMVEFHALREKGAEREG